MSGAGNGAHSKGLAVERKGLRGHVPDTEPGNTRHQYLLFQRDGGPRLVREFYRRAGCGKSTSPVLWGTLKLSRMV